MNINIEKTIKRLKNDLYAELNKFAKEIVRSGERKEIFGEHNLALLHELSEDPDVNTMEALR